MSLGLSEHQLPEPRDVVGAVRVDVAAGTRAARGVAPGSSRPGATSVTSAARVLTLQRSVGNRAVATLLASRPAAPLQRLSVHPVDLDPQIGASTRVAGLFGRSTFASIKSTLAEYQRAATAQKRSELLQRLDNLCALWINEHSGSATSKDLPRRSVITRMLDEIPSEQRALSQSLAQEIYMSNVEQSGKKGSGEPGSEFALEGLQQTGKMAAESGVDKGGRQLAQSKGLSEAEVAAIRIFTASDYSYINPATANSPSWLKAQKAKKELNMGHVADKTLMEEGSLHSGVAMQGLNKLDAWTADSYRGARYTTEEFENQFVKTNVVRFDSFASSAQEVEVANNFAHGLGIEYKIDPDKDIAVVCTLTNTGGRDISQLSSVKKEKEVLLLPGTKFVVFKVEEVDGNEKYPALVEKAKKAGQPLPRKWYLVHLVHAPRQPLPALPPKTA